MCIKIDCYELDNVNNVSNDNVGLTSWTFCAFYSWA